MKRGLSKGLRTAASCMIVLTAFQGGAASQVDDAVIHSPPGLALLAGQYRYVGNADVDHARIQKSIEAAVTSLGWVGRKIAASRLANHKELPKTIEISRAGDNVSVIMGQYSAVAPLDGEERELVGPNRRDSRLSYRITDDAIVQLFVFEHARRKSTYRFNESGQLVMSVYMTSEKLASPISYELVYAAEAR